MSDSLSDERRTTVGADRTGDAVHAAALAALPLQTPHRLRRLLRAGAPTEVWHRIRAGERPVAGLPDEVWAAWRSVPVDLPDTTWRACVEGRMTVTWLGASGYPDVLAGDASPPPVLFVRGDVSVLTARRVGIIGTRSATRAGRHVARTLGRDLAAAGVCVVSGLARGIDAESHVGALDADGAPPVAVVASGLDVVYPPEHRGIWDRVAAAGALVSESPPGAAPERHRFPMRNRILAALSEVLVVVESRRTGGSMITVREAMKRDVQVLAVPGAPSMRASEGTNDLLRDGCGPVTGADDVLIALGMDHRRTHPRFDPRPPPSEPAAGLLDLLRGPALTLDDLALRSGLGVVRTAVLLGRLEAEGWVAHSGGWWEALVL